MGAAARETEAGGARSRHARRRAHPSAGAMRLTRPRIGGPPHQLDNTLLTLLFRTGGGAVPPRREWAVFAVTATRGPRPFRSVTATIRPRRARRSWTL